MRLPKAFRFEGDEVLIEKRGGTVVLRPKARAMTLGDLVRMLRREFPDADDFPDRDQPKKQQKRDLNFDYKAGKLPESDYQTMRSSLEEEAAAVLAEISRLESGMPAKTKVGEGRA